MAGLGHPHCRDLVIHKSMAFWLCQNVLFLGCFSFWSSSLRLFNLGNQ